MALVHPLVQRLLVAEAAGHAPQGALAGALDCCTLPPGSGSADGDAASLRALLLAHPDPPTVLAAAANASGHPCAMGMLLAQLLGGSIVHSSELLAALPPAGWAAAVAGLHAAASSGTLPPAARGAARQACGTVVKMLVTCGGGAEQLQQQPTPQLQQQQQRAERCLQELRQAWSGISHGGDDGSGSSADGAALLAAAVEVVEAEVFPRQRARRCGGRGSTACPSRCCCCCCCKLASRMAGVLSLQPSWHARVCASLTCVASLLLAAG